MMTPRETVLWAVQELRDTANVVELADDQEMLDEAIERAQAVVDKLEQL